MTVPVNLSLASPSIPLAAFVRRQFVDNGQ